MRAVLQRVSGARVLVDGTVRGEIGKGVCVLLGVEAGDDAAAAARVAAKVARLRIFENEHGKFDRSVVQAGGAALVVSNFTLVGDTSKGNRPSFTRAAAPDEAERLYDEFCRALAAEGVAVERGVFGARMTVELANDGPVTIVL